MTKYLVIYHAPAAAFEKMKDATPEQMKAGMEPWMQWAERCGEGLVDLGSPLGVGRKITAAGSSPSDKEVAGVFDSAGRERGRGARAAAGPSSPGMGGRLRDRSARGAGAAGLAGWR